jgi:hypothetical protein
MLINFEETPLINDSNLHETVAIPLSQEVRRPASRSARRSHFE